jgi:hypothetical protein
MTEQALSIVLEDENLVKVEKGKIIFNCYEKIKNDAEALANLLKATVITDETLIANKKLIAEVRKRLKFLNDAKIKIKKQLLEPFGDFDAKIKEVSKIVEDAEKEYRERINEIEEKRIADKADEMCNILAKRLKQYPLLNFGNCITLFFENFWKSKYFTKMYTENKIEAEMIAWLEEKNKEVQAIQNMSDNEAAAVMSIYMKTLDLPRSLSEAKIDKENNKEFVKKLDQNNEKIEYAKQQLEKIKNEEFENSGEKLSEQNLEALLIRSKIYFDIVIQFLQKNKIPFTILGEVIEI